jgi:hypothetical protein
MADIYKCTKLAFGTVPSISSGYVGFEVTMIDPTVNPSVPFRSTGEMPTADVEDPSNIQGGVNSQVNADYGDGIDWAL